jgi:hypothetical protein
MWWKPFPQPDQSMRHTLAANAALASSEAFTLCPSLAKNQTPYDVLLVLGDAFLFSGAGGR